MSEERFARIKEILLAARERAAAERDAFLESACGGDAALRREVESLLAHEGEAPDMIRTHALAGRLGRALGETFALGQPAALPDRIGPYRILELLGEGGMGLVYRAEQLEPIRREVAIKVIRRGLDTERVVGRFESERQALALMDHPGIARVLDAGADSLGRPYFVMELVRGEPITAFCDRHRYTTRQRLELFLVLCQAVQHAHQKGVIHRDLKPSNVLVSLQDGKPAPKIIDFGIAKAIEQPVAGEPLLTQQGQLVGTPEYMSPEQAGAIPGGVDTRTDVYSLGVLLYELLTGHRPYRFPSQSAREILRVIAEEEPGRPSTAVTLSRDGEAQGSPKHWRRQGPTAIGEARRTSVARLRRELSGDLDNILLMALRKEPARRYPSVEHLAEDLRRHLEGRPVLARRPTWAYRSGKFVRRHRVAVGVAAALLLWLAGLAVVLAAQSARVARERDRALAAQARARTEAETSRQISDFLLGLFGESNPGESRGESLTAREILARGRDRVEKDLAGQLVVQARMLNTLGEVYHSLGDYEQARALLERALAIRRRELGPNDPELAQTLGLLGTVTHDQGELDASEKYDREALEIQRRALGPDHADVAETVVNLAITLQAKGDLAAAEPLYREGLALNRRRYGVEHVEVAWAMYSLGWVLHQEGRYADADTLYRGALAMQRKLLGERHPDVAGTLNNLAGLRWHLGDYAEAESLFRDALGIYRALYHDEHVAVARAELNLARALRSLGRYDEGERLARHSLALCRKLVGEDHPYVSNHLYMLAMVLIDRGQYAEAERLARGALAQRVAQRGEVSEPVAGAREALGMTLLEEHRLPEARRQFEQALAVRRARQPAGHPEIAIPLSGLGRTLLASGDAAGAEAPIREALKIREAAFSEDHPLLAESQVAVGRCLAARGRFAAAESLMTAGRRTLEATLVPGARARRQALEAMIDLYRRWDRPDLVAALQSQALRETGLTE